MNHRGKVFLISGAFAEGLTLILALLNIRDWSGVTAAALLLMLWSEAVLFGGFALMEKLASGFSRVFSARDAVSL